MILRLPETQRCRDACGSGLYGIRADPSPAQELPRAFERPKPFLERRQDSDDDVLLCPERRRRIWRLLAKPKQARNFKDLKHLKCRYTFRIRAQKNNIYIADSQNNRIRKVSPNGIITTVAGNGRRNDTGDGGPAKDASLMAP